MAYESFASDFFELDQYGDERDEFISSFDNAVNQLRKAILGYGLSIKDIFEVDGKFSEEHARDFAEQVTRVYEDLFDSHLAAHNENLWDASSDFIWEDTRELSTYDYSELSPREQRDYDCIHTGRGQDTLAYIVYCLFVGMYANFRRTRFPEITLANVHELLQKICAEPFGAKEALRVLRTEHIANVHDVTGFITAANDDAKVLKLAHGKAYPFYEWQHMWQNPPILPGADEYPSYESEGAMAAFLYSLDALYVRVTNKNPDSLLANEERTRLTDADKELSSSYMPAWVHTLGDAVVDYRAGTISETSLNAWLEAHADETSSDDEPIYSSCSYLSQDDLYGYSKISEDDLDREQKAFKTWSNRLESIFNAGFEEKYRALRANLFEGAFEEFRALLECRSEIDEEGRSLPANLYADPEFGTISYDAETLIKAIDLVLENKGFIKPQDEFFKAKVILETLAENGFSHGMQPLKDCIAVLESMEE